MNYRPEQKTFIHRTRTNTSYIFRQNSGNPSGYYNVNPYLQGNNLLVTSEDSDSSAAFILDKDSV